MSLAELAGRTFAPTEPFPVTQDRVEQFARAIGSDLAPATVAGPAEDERSAPVPPTFPIVVAFAAIRGLVEDPESGLSLAGLVHGEQRFTYERPVRVGDELTAQLSVESVRGMGDAAWLRTRSEITDRHGDLVVTAWATLVHRRPTPPEGPDGAVPGPREGS